MLNEIKILKIKSWLKIYINLERALQNNNFSDQKKKTHPFFKE